MDLNTSNHSVKSTDTDILVKIPHNFFDPNLNEKSHFSNDQSFMREIDNFLVQNQQQDILNSTTKDLPTYANFSDNLMNSQNDPAEQDLNLQLVTIFQKKIQQCQVKISGLTKSLQEKDKIITSLKSNEGLDVENAKLKEKVHTLEKEVNDTINLIKKFESKNEILELKIDNLTSTSKEMSDISKKQIQELEIRLSNSLKVEKERQQEIDSLKEKLKSEKENLAKEKNSKTHIERENSNLKSQIRQAKEDKVKCLEKFEQEKHNNEMKQKKIFNSMMNEFSEKERKLVKELDMQRATLKNYYQTQLETALEEKVKEFQDQLEKFQYEIRIEAEQKERASNERALSQMEKIIQKNEEEIDLIRRKCSEEVELYKIQLMNASRTIEELEGKLSEYQLRRQNIADTLHTIMESQWKKILDVLTCPSRAPSNFDSNEVSESDNNRQYVVNHNEQMMNNLSRSEENLKSELLRNYIDKLLRQPPKSTEDGSTKTARTRSNKVNKPWKPS